MKVALGQMNVIAGAMSKNVDTMLSMISQAKKEQVDLIIFPELCISGSLLADKWFDNEFIKTVMSYNETILNASDNIGIIWGNVSTILEDEEKYLLNCAYFAYNKEWVKRENDLFEGASIKYTQQNHRIHEDSRYFTSCHDLCSILNIKQNEFASPFIFEKDNQTTRINIIVGDDLIVSHKTDMIINIASNAYEKGKEMDNTIDIPIPYIYVNAVGMQHTTKNVCVYDGNSSIYNEGKLITNCNDSFKEECKIADLNESSLAVPCENKLLEALLFAIREWDKQIFNSRFKWLIGLSGGLDSSVNAALLSLALGSDRVIGLNMATKYNSSTTIDNAHKLANAVNMDIRDGIIQKLVEEQIECLKQYTNKEISEFAIENIQARTRGNILSSISQVEDAVVINNGNKVEAALGYATLYGDTIGCLGPLQDLTKVELFELSHTINNICGKEVIPYNLLPEIKGDTISWEMPPSAELKNNQLDPMKWFYHDEIIRSITENPYNIENIMEQYLDKSIYDTELGKWIKYYGLDDPKKFIEDIEWILNKMELGVFKRVQSCPIISISKSSFGNDFRENQTKFEKSQKYLSLKESILNENK